MMDARPGSLLKAAGSLLALLAWGSAGCGSMGSGAGSAASEQHPLLGAAAPPFSLPAPDGKQKIQHVITSNPPESDVD